MLSDDNLVNPTTRSMIDIMNKGVFLVLQREDATLRILLVILTLLCHAKSHESNAIIASLFLF